MKKNIYVVFLLAFLLALLLAFLLYTRFIFAQIIPYELEGKIGFINEHRKKITDPIYVSVFQVSKNAAYVRSEDKRYIIINKRGEVINTSLHYDGGLIGDNHYYIWDTDKGITTVFSLITGKQTTYSNMRIFMGASNELVTIRDFSPKDGFTRNYMNFAGQKILLPNNAFTRIYDFNDEDQVGVIVDENFEYRTLDKAGNFISEKTWWFLGRSFSSGLSFGYSKTGKGYFDKSGNLKIEVKTLSETSSDHYDFMPNFNPVLPCIQEGSEKTIISEFQKYTSSNWVLIDTQGNIRAKNIQADYISPFSSGVAFIIQNGKYGLIDTTGKFIVNCEYTIIEPAIHGYSRAKIENKDVLISKTGQVFLCKDF